MATLAAKSITPFLLFDGNAEEAVAFYLSVFRSAKMGEVVRWGVGSDSPEGRVLTISFELNGLGFVALNGPKSRFTEAVSFAVACADQAEIDYYWDRLGEGGEHGPCGWLKDRFGLSWQVAPAILPELIGGPDLARTNRVMRAVMEMGKLDLAAMQRAYRG